MSTTFQELEREQKRHAEEGKRLLDAIREAINGLPDNPRIRRLPGNPRAFVASFKDMGNNWSVEHHDFKRQYELVVDDICKSHDPALRLRNIIDHGRIKVGSNPGYLVELHEDVVEHLVKLAGLRWKSVAEWPEGTCPGDRSDDYHGSRREAKAVCGMLRQRGFGGDGKVFPTKTWMEVA